MTPAESTDLALCAAIVRRALGTPHPATTAALFVAFRALPDRVAAEVLLADVLDATVRLAKASPVLHDAHGKVDASAVAVLVADVLRRIAPPRTNDAGARFAAAEVEAMDEATTEAWRKQGREARRRGAEREAVIFGPNRRATGEGWDEEDAVIEERAMHRDLGRQARAAGSARVADEPGEVLMELWRAGWDEEDVRVALVEDVAPAAPAAFTPPGHVERERPQRPRCGRPYPSAVGADACTRPADHNGACGTAKKIGAKGGEA